MNKNLLIRAFRQGTIGAIAGWVLYGVLTSLLDDDPLFEEMFETSGILFAVFMAVAGIVCCYRKLRETETAKES